MRVVAVVGRQKWRTKLLADFDEFRICFYLQWNAVVLKFNKEIIFTENILQSCRSLEGLFILSIFKCLQNMPAQTTRSCDKP